MKNTRRRIVILSFLSVIAITAIVMLSVYIVGLNKTKDTEKLVYNATPISEGDLIYSYDDVNLEAEFIGINPDALSTYVDFDGTLLIPEKVDVDGELYTVTKIAKIEADSANAKVTDQLTGLIVPNSVQYIAPQAFETFASLVYMSVPFVGTERGAAENSSAESEDERPLGYFFSTAKNASFVANANNLKYKPYSDSTTYYRTFSRWYKGENDADAINYLYPASLDTVIVTDDTKLPDRAFFELKTVTKIDISEFKGNELSALSLFGAGEELREVILPDDDIATIGSWFFSQSQKLEKVKLPYGLTEIPEGAFYHCYGLKEIVMPQTIISFGKGAFKQCGDLVDFKLYNKTTTETELLEQTGFRIPNGVITIAEEAFAGCSQIITANLVSDTLESIGSGAFKGCYQLESIALPFIGKERGNANTKEALFGYIFGTNGTTSAEDGDAGIITPSSVYQYCDAELKDGSYFAIPSSLKSITINGETVVARGSLMNLTNVNTIYIGDSVTSISEGAFAGSSGIVDITLPFVGNNANGNRFSKIFGTIAQDDMYAVDGYYVPNNLESITITNQPTIKTGSFNNLTSLKNLAISDVTTYIEEAILYNNHSLETLKLPFVGNQRGEFFAHYWWWRDKAWRNTVQWIFSSNTSGSEEYANKSLVYYDSYIKYIPTSLRLIEITDETYIGTYSFRDFKYVTDIRISNTPSGIARGGFAGCSNLQSVTLPYIGADINSTNKSGDSYVLGWIFGVDYYDNSYSAIQYGTRYYVPNTLKKIIIHGESKAIPTQAFANMTYIENVSIAAQIQSLGNSAFYNCKNLTNLTYDKASFTHVGDYAFYGCSKVDMLYQETSAGKPNARNFIPGTVKTIGSHAFEGTAISYIDFNRFTSIGDYAFKNCLSLEEINIPAINSSSVLQNLGTGVFSDCGYLTSVTLGSNAVSKYLFKNCISLSTIDLSGVTTVIPEGLFYGCTSLIYDTSASKDGTWNGVGVNISDSTSIVGPYAFYGCSSLESFEITTTLTTIQTRAFNNCISFDSLIIPDTVTTIEPNVWNGCNEEVFCFYVFAPESEWSDGWVENWNCDFPVYLLGQADESLYNFEYIPEYMAYELVSVKIPDALVGIVNVPKTHNGVRVVSIRSGAFSDQPRITGFVLSSNVTHIAERVTTGTDTAPGAFDIEGTVLDIYLGLTEQEAFNCGLLTNEVDGDGDIIGRSNNEDNWILNGYVYYRDDWEYGDAYKTVPYLKVSEFNVVLDSEMIYYDGYAQTPGIEQITTDAHIVDPSGLLALDNTVNVDFFDFTYSNNVAAGTAYVNLITDQVAVNKYNKSVADKDRCYFYGSGKAPFTINKKLIDIYPMGGEFQTVYGEPWKNYVWNASNIEGLEGTSFVFSGTLTTKSENAGTYKSADMESGSLDGNIGAFKWENGWHVYLHGVDVSRNFLVRLAPLPFGDLGKLIVEIKKRDVLVEWTGGRWSDDKSFYLWPYTGKVIQPQATAKTTNNGVIIDGIMTASLPTIEDQVIYPTYVKNAAGDYEFAVAGLTATSYRAVAQLTSSASKNYNLVINTPAGLQSVTQDSVYFHVINGTVVVSVNLPNYVIEPDADYWSYSDWYNSKNKFYSVRGLGEGMYFSGELITTDDEGGNQKGEHSTSLGTIVWNPRKTIDANNTNSEALDYYIYKLNDDGSIKCLENQYFDVVVNANVVINYNKFDVIYKIDNDVQNAIPSTDGSGNLIYEINYQTEGLIHEFIASITNTDKNGNLITGSSILYLYDATESTTTPKAFKEIGEYRIGVQISRKNFETYYANIDLNVLKSDITFDSLTKEYDGLPVDPNTKILKIARPECDALAEEQRESLKYTYYLQSDTTYSNPLESAPWEIGKYVVHATAIESQYFNELDSYIPFEITKRKIYIDVEQNGSFKDYDGEQWAIEFNGVVDRLLEGDILTGVLKTAGKDPDIYDSADPTKWYWSPSWRIYNAETSKDNSEYYEIVLQGKYEIRKLQFQSTSDGLDIVFDGFPHKITVDVTVPTIGYTIYYYHDYNSPTSIVNESNDEGIFWRTTPYNFFVPGVYTVSYKLVADYYQTVYGHETIIIREKEIDYDLPELKVDFTGSYQQFRITVNDPASAQVLYSLDGVNYSTLYPEFIDIGTYKIYYKIVEEYYKTVDSHCEFVITDEDLADVSSSDVVIDAYDEFYDTNTHSVTVTVARASMISNGYKVYYRLDPQDSWSLSNPTFVNAGYYPVYVRVVSPGHKIYEAASYVNIKKLSFDDLSVQSYNKPFDNQYHSIEILGLEHYEDVDYTIYYSIDPHSQENGEGWTTNIFEYKNANSVANYIYVKVVADNYEDKYLEGTVMITVLANPSAYIPDPLEIEYSGRPINDVEVVTVHDGVRNYYYYNTIGNDIDGYEVDYSERISAPTELGMYYVKVQILATANCGEASCEGYFKIVPRVLTPVYTEEVEYDGEAHKPYVTVVTGTEDVIFINTVADGFTDDPIEIGEYKYKLSFFIENPNYVLDTTEIIFKIVPRKVVFQLTDEKEYDGELPWSKDSNWDEFGARKILPQHILHLEMETSSYLRDTYVYSPDPDAVGNIVRITKFDITDVSGNSVLSLYDVTFDIVVQIVYQRMEYEFEDMYIEYDGKYHKVNLAVNSHEIENPELYYAESHNPENPNATYWLPKILEYRDVGKYEIWVKIVSTNCEDIITMATLYIIQGKPEIVITDFNETYLDKYYQIDYQVTNISGIGKATSVKYYPSEDYTTKEVIDLYKEQNFTSKMYKNALEKVKDAGEYIAVVMYEETYNWKYAYAFKTITVKHKEIHIALSASNLEYTKDYDGKKFDTIFLGGSTINSDDLVDGHELGNRKSQYRIQTCSANAGEYLGESGFEFRYMEIYDQEGNNVYKNYKPIITTGLKVTINRINIDPSWFSVSDNEREYTADYDEDLELYVPRLADPIFNYPENYYFDNKPHYLYFTVKDGSFGDSLGKDNQSDVGYYYVIVTFEQGTNFNAYDAGTFNALVRITPKTVDVEWSELEQVFTAEGLAPKATFKDVYMTDVDLEVFFNLEDGTTADSVLKAGSYQAFARFETAEINYVLNTETCDNTFKITPVQYTLLVDDVSYNTQSEWRKDIFTTDFTDFIEGLILTDKSGTTNATLSTNSHLSGIYSGSGLVWNYKVTTEDGIDVTDSVKLIADGRVLIVNENIEYTKSDVIVTYDGQAHSIWEGLTIKKPADYTVQYSTDGTAWSAVAYDFEYTNVGTYKVFFKIDDSTGMYTEEDFLFIQINKADPTFAITNNIDKVYDAEPIDASALKYTGAFNGTYDDLVYTYYECDENFSQLTGVPMATPPVDVGYYQLVITSAADDLPGGNYNKLTAVKNFEIKQRVITLTIDEEVEVDNTTIASIWSLQKDKQAATSLNLADFDYLTFGFETTSAKKLGKYSDNNLYEYRGPSYINYFGDENYFKFVWKVERYSETGTLVYDTSMNYKLQLDFDLYIRYKLIEHTIEDVHAEYNPSKAHSATLVTPVTGLTQQYTYDNPTTPGVDRVTDRIDSMSFTDPGTYVISYKLSKTEYEDAYGTYIIHIDFADRAIDNTVLADQTKVYDGVAVTLPDYKFVPGVYSDDYDMTKIVVEFQRQGYNYKTNSITDVGIYNYKMTIPASTFYGETVIQGTYTITKATLDIEGTYYASYTGESITYSDFGVTSAFTITSAGNPLPSGTVFAGTLVTQYGNKGEYTSAANTLYWQKGFKLFDSTGKDLSTNYTVNLEAKIVIQDGIMVFDCPLNQTFEYDGSIHTAIVTMYKPIKYTKISYSLDGSNFTTEIQGYKNVCVNQPVWVMIEATNYQTEIVEVAITVTKAETKMVIPDLSKVYDYQEVLLPEYVETNTDVARDKWILRYQEFIDDEWKDMGDSRPIDVGVYRLIIEIEEGMSTNYKGGQFVGEEFTITGLPVDINWTGSEFIYNGKKQHPTATINSGVVVPLAYNIIPNTTLTPNADADSINAGVYTVELIIDSTNSNFIFKEESYRKPYSIVERNITLTLKKTRNHISSPYEFSYGLGTNPDTIPFEYTVSNLVENHYFTSSSILMNKYQTVGVYTQKSDFEWKYGVYDILNADGVSVTDNYNLEYELELTIDFSSIEHDVFNVECEYDGQDHQITIVVDNSSELEITYSETKDGVYTTTNPKFRDVYLNDKGEPEKRMVWFKIVDPTGNKKPEQGYGYVWIKPKSADIQLMDPYLRLDKIYDGLNVVNPEVTYADMDILPRTITYTYHQVYDDGSIGDPKSVVSSAGNYVLYIRIDDGHNPNYTNGEKPIYFKIDKRVITISVIDEYGNPLPVTKVYDGLTLVKHINNVYVKNLANQSTDGILGEFFEGDIQTRSARVGNYTKHSDFVWVDEYKILNYYYDSVSGEIVCNDVSKNYELVYDLDFTISEAQIEWEAYDVEADWDGFEHAFEVTVNRPYSYTVYYWEEGKEPSTNLVTRTDRGTTTVYFKIVADNYVVVEDNRRIIIKGQNIDDPSNPDNPDDPDNPEPVPNFIYKPVIEYNGKPYMSLEPTGKPVYSNSEFPTTGAQTIRYYKADEYALDPSTAVPLASAPIDAGSYVFIIDIAADSTYEEFTTDAISFKITRMEVDITWEGLTVYYNGQFQIPKASYTNVAGVKVELDVNAQQKLACDTPYPVVATAKADDTDTATNYKLKNYEEEFTIKQYEVDEPEIMDNMSFVYSEGYELVDLDGLPFTFVFGDVVKVYDKNGNIYVLNSDGSVSAITDAEGNILDADPKCLFKIYLSSDYNVDGVNTTITEHKITVELDDTSNYIWKNKKNSDNLEFKYTITQYEIPNPEDYEVKTMLKGQTEKAYYLFDDKPIEPKIEIKLYTADGIYIKTLTDLTTSSRYAEYEIYEYVDNDKISNPDEDQYAKVLVRGINNFNFELEIEFEITKTPPSILELAPGHTLEFISIVTDPDTSAITVVEDGTIERKDANQANVYLGRLHQSFTIQYVVSQFKNDSTLLKVYDSLGNLVDQKDYSKPFGTGYRVELYEKLEDTTPIDSITGILYGDLNGDGAIDAFDGSTMEGLLAGTTLPSDLGVNYYAGLITRTSQTPDAFEASILEIYLGAQTNDNDFNYNFLTKAA